MKVSTIIVIIVMIPGPNQDLDNVYTVQMLSVILIKVYGITSSKELNPRP